MSDYEVTDSDYDYNENEKILLQSVRKRQNNEESEEEVLRFHSSESEKEDYEEDIEQHEDDLPSAKAWGKRKAAYYNTDYVDEDFGGYQGKDAEEAEIEEEEARAIQERLMQELDETDYMLDTFSQVVPSSEEKVEEKIKTDVSGLSRRDKLSLFAKESPEFSGLIEDFKEKMSENEEKLQPIISLINSGKIPNLPICKFVKTKYHLILNYCTNILYYLLLKARHVPIQSHPVIQRLFQYRHLLKQLESVNASVLPQISMILEEIKRGEGVKLVNAKPYNKRSKKNINTEDSKEKESKGNDLENKFAKTVPEDSNELGVQDISMEDFNDTANSRRAITYQIAKNKGLTPYRKKELRNPRVKHRLKYQKAKIRRKGQVREPRKEIQKYGGEISGIKIGVSKSIKIK